MYSKYILLLFYHVIKGFLGGFLKELDSIMSHNSPFFQTSLFTVYCPRWLLFFAAPIFTRNVCEMTGVLLSVSAL